MRVTCDSYQRYICPRSGQGLLLALVCVMSSMAMASGAFFPPPLYSDPSMSGMSTDDPRIPRQHYHHHFHYHHIVPPAGCNSGQQSQSSVPGVNGTTQNQQPSPYGMPGWNPSSMSPFGNPMMNSMSPFGMPPFGNPMNPMSQYGMSQFGMPPFNNPMMSQMSQFGMPQFGMSPFGNQMNPMSQFGNPGFMNGPFSSMMGNPALGMNGFPLQPSQYTDPMTRHFIMQRQMTMSPYNSLNSLSSSLNPLMPNMLGSNPFQQNTLNSALLSDPALLGAGLGGAQDPLLLAAAGGLSPQAHALHQHHHQLAAALGASGSSMVNMLGGLNQNGSPSPPRKKSCRIIVR